MKASRFSEAQKAFILKQGADGMPVAELAERGLKVDYRTVWNFVHAEKLSFKKNRRGQRTRPARRRAPTGSVG